MHKKRPIVPPQQINVSSCQSGFFPKRSLGGGSWRCPKRLSRIGSNSPPKCCHGLVGVPRACKRAHASMPRPWQRALALAACPWGPWQHARKHALALAACPWGHALALVACPWGLPWLLHVLALAASPRARLAASPRIVPHSSKIGLCLFPFSCS